MFSHVFLVYGLRWRRRPLHFAINICPSPFASSPKPLHQSEAWCTTIHMKMSLICKWMKSHFHMKGWAPRLILRKRFKEFGNGLVITLYYSLILHTIWTVSCWNFYLVLPENRVWSQGSGQEVCFSVSTIPHKCLFYKYLSHSVKMKNCFLSSVSCDNSYQIILKWKWLYS